MDFRTGMAALRSAQKPSRGTAAYSRLVNRPLGRVTAAWLNTLRVTPNQATVLSATCSAAGIAVLVLVPPHWWSGLLVAVLLASGYVLDSVDGQLARLRGGGSKAGEWLDHTVDTFKTLGVHLAVLVHFYRFPGEGVAGSAWWLLVPLLFTLVAGATYFGLMLIPTLRPATPGAPGAGVGETAENPLRKFAILPTDYGFQCWVFVLLGWQLGFRIAWLLVFLACAGAMALALRKWWRELSALDVAPQAADR